MDSKVTTPDESLEDVEIGNGTRNNSKSVVEPVSKKKKAYLRWERVTKTVEIQEINSGLLRSSIATPSTSTKELVKKQGKRKKIILNEISGSAAPSEVLALMGPSGSGSECSNKLYRILKHHVLT